jgi:hypothetical protein
MNIVAHYHIANVGLPEACNWLNTNGLAEYLVTLIPFGFQTQVVLKLPEDTLSECRARGVLWY